MSYPFVETIATHRLAHELYLAGIPLLPRMMNEVAHGRTGVVIGETAVIGCNVKLYQGGALGAVLGGGTTIGRGSVIGGDCWVTTSVPPGHRGDVRTRAAPA